MQAQDTGQTEIRYDLYLVWKDKHFFCKRYLREGAAINQADHLEGLYGKWGYTTKIIPIDLIPPGQRVKNGSHNAGTPPQEQGNPPT